MFTMNHSTPDLPSKAWSKLEQVLERFEKALREGSRPRLEEYLQVQDLDQQVLLVELIHAELEYRFEANESVAVEDYLVNYPEIAQDRAAVVGLIALEHKLRQGGPAPGLDDYLRRFPHLAEELRKRWHAGSRVAREGDPQSPNGLDSTVYAERPPSSAPTMGIGVPGYEIVRKLGQGGMGVVYLARHLQLKRLVALKTIRGEAQADSVDITRFLNEAEAVARLRHPNIVGVFDVGRAGNRPYFTMEYVEGGSLSRKLADTAQTARASAHLVETLARAIHVAHASGIVHRDLKPANVLIQESGDRSQVSGVDTHDPQPSDSPLLTPGTYTAKITDFGLAKRLDDGPGLTHSNAVLGTPSYMAPEQAAGKNSAVGPHTDVYALGAILYELLTARPPFKAASAWETVAQVIADDPVAPSRLQPSVARDLETICLKALAKEPEKRYPTALALAEDLRRFQAQEPILARPASAFERCVKWVRRHPLRAALTGVSALAFLGMVAGAVFFGLYQDQKLTLVQTQLDQELAEKKRAQDEEERFRQLEAASQEDFFAGKASFERREWEKARTKLAAVLARLERETGLEDMKQRALHLHEHATSRLAERALIQRFRILHDEAYFYSTNVTGLGKANNLKRTRAKALEALELCGITGQSSLQAFLAGTHVGAKTADQVDKDEKVELTSRCYGLLLVLANALAQPAGDEPNIQDALRWLDRAVQLRVPTRTYHLFRAKFLTLLQDQAGAAAEQQRADTAQAPLEAVDHLLAGLERYQAGHLSAALAHLESTLRAEPDHFWAHFLKGCVYFHGERFADAQASLTACLGQKQDLVWIYLLRAVADGEIGSQILASATGDVLRRRLEANEHFQAAEKDFQTAATLVRTADAQYAFHMNRGVLRLRQQQPADALGDFKAADAVRPGQYQTYLNQAQAYEQQKQWDQARAALDMAITLQGKMAALYRTRARFYLQADYRNLPAALRDLDSALAHASDYDDVATDYKEKGLILVRQKKYAEAAACFEAAVQVRPDFVMAHRLRAESLMELERYADALVSWSIYLHAVNLAPARYLQDKEPLAKAYRARGVVRAKLAQPIAALDDFTRALEFGEDSATYTFRGWVYVVNESPRLALHDFEKAIALDKDHKNGDAYNGRGWCRLQLNQYRAAVRDAEQALRLGPREAPLLYKAARIYALAMVKVRLDPAQQDRQGAELRVQYQDHALELMREALTKIPTLNGQRQFWKEYVLQDEALHFLRPTQEFGRLSALFQEKSRPSP